MSALRRRPANRAVWLALGVGVLAFTVEWIALVSGDAPSFLGIDLRSVSIALMVGGAGLMLLDWFRAGQIPLPVIERIVPSSLALHDWAPIRLRIDPVDRRQALELVDSVPEHARTEGMPLSLEPTPGETRRVELTYRVRPNRRGDVTFGRVRVLGESPNGLWRYTAECGEPTEVRVLPNFATVARYDSLFAEDLESQVGIKRQRRRGEGTEFHQLREYRRGDSLRQIDWKATSRKQTLISREYEDERDQRVVFVLDSSRRMRAKDGDLSHFDHSLNAMILLAHVALRGGDAVGFLSFGDQTRWLPPSKGIGRVNELLDAAYDLEPTTLGADFTGAVEELSRRVSRRSMIVLLTTLRREDAADLEAGVAALRRRHVVLVVNLRPEGLEAARSEPIADLRGAFRFIGALDHEGERKRLEESLRQQGILILDSAPAGLTPRLVSSYLAIKRSGML